MKKPYLRFYLVSLGILLALSAYPLVMGLKLVFLQWHNGRIEPGNYARYVIPYTAICLSVLIAAALHPWIIRLRKAALPAAVVLALALFTAAELYLEGIVINDPRISSAVQMQLLSCIYTPAARMAFMGVYSDAFKIHYFLVSFVMVSLAVSVIYRHGALAMGSGSKASGPLVLQTVAAALYVGLCVLANVTGFFRRPVEVQPLISFLLTGLFFVVLGACAGIFTGSFLTGRKPSLSVWLPGAVASVVCCVMYLGEYLMLNDLYRFGRGFLFEGLPGIALAPADVLIVLLSGAATAFAMAAVRRGAAARRDVSDAVRMG